MNIFDIVFVLLFAYSIFAGVRYGLIMQLTMLLSLLLGAYIAFKFSGLVTKWITDLGVGSQAVYIISFALTFIGVVILARLAGSVIQKILHVALLGWLNKLLGVIFSMAKMAFIISISLFIINAIDRELNFMPRDQVHGSKLYIPLSNLAPAVLPYLNFDKIGSAFREMDEHVSKKVEELKK